MLVSALAEMNLATGKCRIIWASLDHEITDYLNGCYMDGDEDARKVASRCESLELNRVATVWKSRSKLARAAE